MKKVKIFSDRAEFVVEQSVNVFIAKHITGDSYKRCTVMIVYEE